MRSIDSTNAGIWLVAFENSMTLVRGTIVAFLQAEIRDSRAVKLSDSAIRCIVANRLAVCSNVFEFRLVEMPG